MCCVRIQKLYINDIKSFRGDGMPFTTMCWILSEQRKKAFSMFDKEKNAGCFSLQMEKLFNEPIFPASKAERSNRIPDPRHQSFCTPKHFVVCKNKQSSEHHRKTRHCIKQKISLPTADLYRSFYRCSFRRRTASRCDILPTAIHAKQDWGSKIKKL